MRKIYNWGLIFLAALIFNQRLEQGGSIDGNKFQKLSFEERKLALKTAFETDMYHMYDGLNDYVKSCKLMSDLTESQKIELEKYELAFEVASAVKASIDKVLYGKSNLPSNFNCAFHDDSTPSMNYFFDKKGFYCYGCCKNGEIYDVFNLIDIVGQAQGKKPMDFSSQIYTAIKLFVDQSLGKIKNPFGTPTRHSDYIPYTKEMNRVRHNWMNLTNIKEDPVGARYLEGRGISINTAHRLSVMTFHPKGQNGEDWGRTYLTFINSDGSYVRKLIEEIQELSSKCPSPALKWWNSSGTIGVFNGQVVNHCAEYNEICFICECATDALSCEELGYHAVGLNSVSHANRFIMEYVQKTNVRFVCLADMDTAGKEMFDNFAGVGVFIPPYVNGEEGYTLSKYKDVNECLQADREGLARDLGKLSSNAEEFYFNKNKIF